MFFGRDSNIDDIDKIAKIDYYYGFVTLLYFLLLMIFNVYLQAFVDKYCLSTRSLSHRFVDCTTL